MSDCFPTKIEFNAAYKKAIKIVESNRGIIFDEFDVQDLQYSREVSLVLQGIEAGLSQGRDSMREELTAKFPKYEQLPDLYHGRDGMYAVLGYVKEKLFGDPNE